MKICSLLRAVAVTTLAFGVSRGSAISAQQVSAPEQAKVDAAIQQVLQATAVPSASVGIARGGKVVYAKAFGMAKLPRNVGVKSGDGAAMGIAVSTERAVPANAAMAYPVGSISKQFTATCVLLLQERGKLKLDDPVAKWFPDFTRANEVTVRNLLTHTSGYSDYAPQDYTIPAWTKPVKAMDVVTEWAKKPLDFDPGTRWQYSNTNFEIAALIVEKASGMRFHEFLWTSVIEPLKLNGVLDLDIERDKLQVRGYEQHALGPMRPAILEAPGWYYGDAQLAMPVSTLLAWDESIVHRTLLKPESYDAMETEFLLKNGNGSHYGLGVFVGVLPGAKKILYHSGEVGGYVSNNVVALNDDVAYAALTNEEASSAAGSITNALRLIFLPAAVSPKTSSQASGASPAEQRNTLPTAPRPTMTESHMATLLTSLQEEDIDRTIFTADANFYFSDETLHDFAESLAPLGPVEQVQQTSESLRGGMTFHSFAITFAKGKAALTTYSMPDGRIEQFLVAPAE